MGGKSKSITSGYWYKVAFHHGLAATPIDAFLEFRCADKTAWSGELTASGTLYIDQANLFGGEKDQGGIVGDVDVLFGEATQQPNAYLAQAFGSQQPAWRGVTTLVFKGGRFGANNPYPQAPEYKVRTILNGWDNDPANDGSGCWYPETASVSVQQSLPPDAGGWEYQIGPQESDPGYQNLVIPTHGWSTDGQAPFGHGEFPHHTDWPAYSVLWCRRTVTVGSTDQPLTISAENGCVVFIDGVQTGSINPDNVQLVDEPSPYQFPVGAHRTFTLVIKAFDEDPSYNAINTLLRVRVGDGGVQAMNPAHILYDALTSEDRGAEPTASIHDASFRAGADSFYAQGVGLCTGFDPDSETVAQLIQRVEKVAACSVSRSPVDGLWYLDIANGVYTLADLPILTDDDILEFLESPSTLDDVINSISVEYVGVQQNATAITPPVQALALINANGLNHDVRQYHELPTADLANRIAQRDLQTETTPKRNFDLTTTRKPFAWRANTYFRLQAPKRGIADMVCLLAEKSSGTLKSGAMTITASQNVYSLPTASFVTSEPGVDTRPPQIPVAIAQQAAFEAPYTSIVPMLSRADLAALPADVGYLMTVAHAPGAYRDYTLVTSVDGGATYAGNDSAPWCPTALIVEADALQDAAPATTFTLADGAGLTSVALGSATLWGDEIVRVDAIDATAGTLTIGRGCADTVPHSHAANSRIWFYDGATASDGTQYTDGETIAAKLLTNTGSQQLDAALATPLALTFATRAALPYPPAKVRVGGSPYPTSASGDLVLTWARRARAAQADQLIDSEAADIQPADDVRYALVALDADANELVRKDDIDGTTATVALAYTGTVTLVLGAVNDAGESLQPHRLTLDYTPASGATENTIDAATWTPTEVIFVAGGA